MAPELAVAAVVAGRYRLDRLLGEGGMGAVWAATHTVTRRRVALKFLRGPDGATPEARARFLREARAASAVDHPNVVRIHDVFDVDPSTPVIVMDLLVGETFAAQLARERRLTLADTAAVLLPVVSAVGAAHARGIVHRDLKPENIFLVEGSGPAERVRVLDFGIAKLSPVAGLTTDPGVVTSAGAMLGTPYYMSPEQGFGEPDVDHRADVWALGVILYEALSGTRPVEGDTIGQLLKRLVTGNIEPLASRAPQLPAEITGLVGRMLSVPRAERPQDLREVAAVLARHTAVVAPAFGPPGSEAGRDDEPEPPAIDPQAVTCAAPSGRTPSGVGALAAAATTPAPGLAVVATTPAVEAVGAGAPATPAPGGAPAAPLAATPAAESIPAAPARGSRRAPVLWLALGALAVAAVATWAALRPSETPTSGPPVTPAPRGPVPVAAALQDAAAARPPSPASLPATAAAEPPPPPAPAAGASARPEARRRPIPEKAPPLKTPPPVKAPPPEKAPPPATIEASPATASPPPEPSPGGLLEKPPY